MFWIKPNIQNSTNTKLQCFFRMIWKRLRCYEKFYWIFKETGTNEQKFHSTDNLRQIVRTILKCQVTWAGPDNFDLGFCIICDNHCLAFFCQCLQPISILSSFYYLWNNSQIKCLIPDVNYFCSRWIESAHNTCQIPKCSKMLSLRKNLRKWLSVFLFRWNFEYYWYKSKWRISKWILKTYTLSFITLDYISILYGV